MARRIDRLLLLFDADSGWWDVIMDSACKLLSLGGCALCTVTHGLTGERAGWRAYKEELGVPVSYLHRDELTSAQRNLNLPCVLAQLGGEQVVLVGPESLAECKGSLVALRRRLQERAALLRLELPPIIRAA